MESDTPMPLPEDLLIETVTLTGGRSIDLLVAERWPSARYLRALSEQTHLHWWLDADAGEVWCATSARISHGHVGMQLREALQGEIGLLLHDLADAEYSYWELAQQGYETAADRAEHHLAVLDELHSIELAIIQREHTLHPSNYDSYDSPGARIDRALLWRLARVRAEMSYLSGLRAYAIRQIYGTARGSQKRAAAELGVSEPTISTILSSADKRAAELRAIAARADARAAED